jgi:FG-GAP-like repeat
VGLLPRAGSAVLALGLIVVSASVALPVGAATGRAGYLSLAGLPEYAAPVGAGVFPVESPQGVNFLVIGDFNADGHQDVMVVRSLAFSPRTFPVVVMVNRGEGTFVDETSSLFVGDVPQTLQARRVVVADFNGDGRPDVFIADTGEDLPPYAGYQNTLILSAPGGKLVDATKNLPQRADYSHSLAAADLNGDGAVDLFVGNLGRADSSIMLNDGSGHFHDETNGIPAKLADPGQSILTSAAFADVNHDGFPDLIVGGGSNGQYSTAPVVVLNNRHGAFPFVSSELPSPPYGFNSPVDIQTTDLNGDGWPDLVISYVKTPSQIGARWIQLLINNRNGTFRDETQTRLPQHNNSDSWIKWIQIIDLNHDGAPDLATAVAPNVPSSNESPPVYLNDGHGHFAPLPHGLGFDVGNTYNFIDATGNGAHDVVFSTDNASIQLERKQPALGYRLYATLSPTGVVALTSDQGANRPIHAGRHRLLIWDDDTNASLQLNGPGVNLSSGRRHTGITTTLIRLHAGATYHYRSDQRHHGTIHVAR